jgi:hypothetical protein
MGCGSNVIEQFGLVQGFYSSESRGESTLSPV